MTELFLMRGNPEVECYPPFTEQGELSDEAGAFRFPGVVRGRMTRSWRPKTDVIEIDYSLCWSDKVQQLMAGLRLPLSLKTRNIVVTTFDHKPLYLFNWAIDFCRIDVLNYELSDCELIGNAKAVLRLHAAVVNEANLPPFDIFGSLYSQEFFVTATLRDRILDAGCAGFTFRPVAIHCD